MVSGSDGLMKYASLLKTDQEAAVMSSAQVLNTVELHLLQFPIV